MRTLYPTLTFQKSQCADIPPRTRNRTPTTGCVNGMQLALTAINVPLFLNDGSFIRPGFNLASAIIIPTNTFIELSLPPTT